MSKEQELEEEVRKIYRLVIRFGLLIRLEVYTKFQTAIYIGEIIDGLTEKLPTNWISALRSASTEYIESIQKSSYSDPVIDTLRRDIIASNLNPVQFVQDMDIDLSGVPNFSIPKEESLNIAIIEVTRPPHQDEIDFSVKEVGQRVEISHPLFTNMLVTSDGMQMPSKSFLIPAAIELMKKQAVVIEVGSEKFTYTCGACDQRHVADVRIGFPEFTMEFYINNDLLKVIDNEKIKK